MKQLDLLRNKMREEGIDVYYFNTSDYHMSEYVAKYFKTICYFSGFTGSLATLLVDLDKAYIFVDGRYHQQADKQCLCNDVTVVKLGTEKALEPIDFINKNYQGKVIGFDGKRTSIAFGKQLDGFKIKCVDIYSSIIENREPLSKDEIYLLEEEYTGKICLNKINEVKAYLNGKSLIVNNLESIAYLLNLRGNDIVYTPVFYAYLIIDRDDVILFINSERISKDVNKYLSDNKVIVKDYDQYYQYLKTMKNQTILLDENKINYQSYLLLKDNNKLINEISIIEINKSIKNDVEIENSKLAHIYDGVAMVRFLKWIKNTDCSKLTEVDAVKYLNNCRLSFKAFDLSFEPIVAYGKNAAMMHYSPTVENCSKLDNKDMLLIDSGGQYKQGTTDITRTIALGKVSDEMKKHFTSVLKSMFNLSSLVFLKGMCGNQIDVCARRDLWEIGINYRCGTGHGVGQVSSVHEMPPNIRYTNNVTSTVPIEIGNIFSDEPGVYLEDKYGIRCENMLVCKENQTNEYGTFLSFDTLTLCPFDLDLIDINYLDEKTIKLLNDYHKTVYEKLSPYLNDDEKDYLMKITKKIA